MKCEKCDKLATFHITELTDGKVVALHLCEDHAREYLASDAPSTPEEEEEPTLAGALAKQLAVGQAAEELAKLDQQTCPVCGITFYEFRNKGRLGCPYDYTCFEKQLEPLLVNIHGETEHTGKRPSRSAAESDDRVKLMRLRREMKDAVAEEHYERATELRDEIKTLEQQLKHE
jgi:protein arginine kinase activator